MRNEWKEMLTSIRQHVMGEVSGHDTFKYSKNFHKQEELDLFFAIMLKRQFVPNF